MNTLTLELSDAQLHTLERLEQQQGTSIHALRRAIINDFTRNSERATRGTGSMTG